MPVQQKTFTLGEIAALCGGRPVDAEAAAGTVIRRVDSVEEAGPDSVTWVADEKNRRLLGETKAGAILGTSQTVGQDPRGIVVTDPEMAIADVLDAFWVPPERPAIGVHSTAVVAASAELGSAVAVGAAAVIHPEARVGDRTIIHEGVSIGRGVTIGADCEVFDRCVIYDRCIIGNRVMIHAGAVIGADGFGYIFRDGAHRKLSHIGTVIIEDDVEIGANTCIDRGKLSATRIGRGSKIDNLVMVAHNVQIGPLCLLAGQCGLSGSVRLGTGVALGGQVGVSHGIRLGDAVKAAAQSGIIGDIEAGQVVFGYPAQDRLTAFRDIARVRKLGGLFEQIAELKRRVVRLEESKDHSEHR